MAIASAVGVAVSCLPELAPLTAEDAGDELYDVPIPPPPMPLCGNGFIDSDAGDGGEQCDPGSAGAKGCTDACTIDCFGDAGLVDPTTNHCYFVSTPGAGFDADITRGNADNRCEGSAAHVVTFVSDDEVSEVIGWYRSNANYWVGLMIPTTAPSVQYVTPLVTEEPGWAPDGACLGCFAHGRVPTDTGFFLAQPEAGLGCVIGVKDTSKPWYGETCFQTVARTICEREPPGTRAFPCNVGNYCFDISATFGTKHYLYSPLKLTASIAETTVCNVLGGDGGTSGTGSLVVFQSREEREQVWYVLNHLPGGAVAPPEFWIGLSSKQGADGGAITPLVWTWDDGEPLGSGTGGPPIPWGDHEPKSTKPGYAYSADTAGNYDSQLAHAQDDFLNTQRPFVCQY